MSREDRTNEEILCAALHIAGHLVARHHLRLPINRPQLWRSGRWPFRIRVYASPMPVPADLERQDRRSCDPFLVATLAGIEAEARFLCATRGVSLTTARRRAARSNRDGDVHVVTALARRARLSQRAARKRAAAIVEDLWVNIVETANFLATSEVRRRRRR